MKVIYVFFGVLYGLIDPSNSLSNYSSISCSLSRNMTFSRNLINYIDYVCGWMCICVNGFVFSNRKQKFEATITYLFVTWKVFQLQFMALSENTGYIYIQSIELWQMKKEHCEPNRINCVLLKIHINYEHVMLSMFLPA